MLKMKVRWGRGSRGYDHRRWPSFREIACPVLTNVSNIDRVAECEPRCTENGVKSPGHAKKRFRMMTLQQEALRAPFRGGFGGVWP